MTLSDHPRISIDRSEIDDRKCTIHNLRSVLSKTPTNRSWLFDDIIIAEAPVSDDYFLLTEDVF